MAMFGILRYAMLGATLNDPRERECTVKQWARKEFPVPIELGAEEVSRIIDCLPEQAFTPWPTCIEINRVRHACNVAPIDVCTVCAEWLELVENLGLNNNDAVFSIG